MFDSTHGRNALLAQLPDDVCERIGPTLESIQLQAGQVLYETPQRQGALYFPRSGALSLVHVLASGDEGEVAMVGREGVVGMSLLIDSHAPPSRAIVQVAGEALLMSAGDVAAEFQRGGILQDLMLRYSQAQIAQMAQITMCSRRHSIENQLCRWLLACWDRAGPEPVRLTHQAIASALCVRRVSISETTRKLQTAGLIACRRSHITLLDRPGMERRSCECYAMMRHQVERLLEDSLAA